MRKDRQERQQVFEDACVQEQFILRDDVRGNGVLLVKRCRKPYQITCLDAAVNVSLSDREIKVLEQTADSTGVKILGADMFTMLYDGMPKRRAAAFL